MAGAVVAGLSVGTPVLTNWPRKVPFREDQLALGAFIPQGRRGLPQNKVGQSRRGSQVCHWGGWLSSGTTRGLDPASGLCCHCQNAGALRFNWQNRGRGQRHPRTVTASAGDEVNNGAGSGGEEPESQEAQAWLQDPSLMRRLYRAESPDAVLEILENHFGQQRGGVVGSEEGAALILAALEAGNADLAFGMLEAMRAAGLKARMGKGGHEWRWRWSPPDVKVYAALVRGLAASLRVGEAIDVVGQVRRRGLPKGEEVSFGKVVGCPSCRNASLAVVQPQHGVQVVPCSQCRYQFELASGTVTEAESEAISSDQSLFQRAFRLLRFRRSPPPAAVHSLVVRAPDGVARTHRFATDSVEIPAQVGDRVTVCSACPSSARGPGLGPLRGNTRTPGWQPGEPMALTNHATGRVNRLLRAPAREGAGAARDLSMLVPAIVILAGGDAATGLISPDLPGLLAIGVTGTVVAGGLARSYLLPRLNQLPTRVAERVAVRQELLAQHEALQTQLAGLADAAAAEVRMLARMCQLANKMEAVGEPAAYSARIRRVREAREGLDQRLAARLELMDSFAKVASMIEIEVEMDNDVLAAESAGAAANIAEEVERLMELNSLQSQWQIQAEANEEVERLLRTESVPEYS
ncbi:hypothetical protein KFL_000830100 [Klebsormidium nitens]|uniref:Uncharacterized protein n=1 Tax=Klebsormidium nitens TaxID=105231 RepID=A0A1Y1I096_KLENI|nr:hypothetical protein KFL_000830100 [Klebsormidium nitens]|eukprot:GAQ81528.1 hypothetical protein KFL_000830100 [Klebsormidium nitens]